MQFRHSGGTDFPPQKRRGIAAARRGGAVYHRGMSADLPTGDAPPIRVLASSISFAAAQVPPLTHFAARPFPTRPASLGSRGNPACLAKRECAVHGGREKRPAGLMGRLRSHCPANAGVGFAGDLECVGGPCRAARVRWAFKIAATNGQAKTKRLSATPCCRRMAVEEAVVSEGGRQTGRAATGAGVRGRGR